MTIEQLKVLITADISGLAKEVKKAKGSLSSLEHSVVNSTRNINNSFKSLAKSVGAMAGITSLAVLGKQAIETASNLQEI